MFKDREWITYETLDNIRKRAAYVVANNLGGMFVWSRMYSIQKKKKIQNFFPSLFSFSL